jgi:CheY-like chemotaxis protein
MHENTPSRERFTYRHVTGCYGEVEEKKTEGCGGATPAAIPPMMNANSEPATAGKVLVIDDEPAILTTLTRLLRSGGYKVQTAQSAREGLNLFQREPWDAVTIDRSMPEMSGEEAAGEMKRLAPHVPIILITGFPAAATRRELFHAILGKPFRSAELLQCLAECVRSGNAEARSENDPPENRTSLPQRGLTGAQDTSHPPRPWERLLLFHANGSAALPTAE